MSILRRLPLLIPLLATPIGPGWAQDATPPGTGTGPDIEILHADRAPLDRGQDEMVLEGHVRLRRGDTALFGDHLRWRRREETLELRGDVRIQDVEFSLASDFLLYDLAGDAATAWGEPRLVQQTPGDGDAEIVLRAVQLRLFPRQGRVEAIEDVRIEQVRGEGVDRRIEMRVSCRVAELLARGRRNVFKGGVFLETEDIGARSGRMLYEQESRRVYLLDGARVWNYDSGGKRLDELQGDKVIHFLETGRTIALGSVRAAVHPDASPGRHQLGRTRRIPSR